MEITINTLTPLWTGGAETGKMARVHEAGLIGSLRWWYEAIIRGLGGTACDPTQHSCTYDPQKLNNGLCEVCQLFGATGWKRRFQLTLVEDNTRPGWVSNDPQPLNIRPPDRSRGWFLPAGRVGSLTYRLHGTQHQPIYHLLRALAEWGAIGAKPQLGYGFFALETQGTITTISPYHLANLPDFGFFRYRFHPPKAQWWLNLPGIQRSAGNPALPQLARHQMLPLTPLLKNSWRYHHWQGPRSLAIQLFGTIDYGRIRSKIAVSWAYPAGQMWEIRGWVWLPEKYRQGHNLIPILQNEQIWRQTLQVQDGELVTAGLLA